MDPFTLTTFYTDKYSEFAEKFKANATAKGLNFDIYKKPDWIPRRGEVSVSSHHNNCKWKPHVIEESLQANELILWLDIDCTIEKINYLPEDFDIGISTDVPDHYHNKISVGWIWFRNSKRTFRFLKKWKQLLKSSKQDHNAFTKAHKEFRNKLTFKEVTDSVNINWNGNSTDVCKDQNVDSLVERHGFL